MKYTVRLLADFVVVAAFAATHTAISAKAASLEQRFNALEAQNRSLRGEPGATGLKFGRLRIPDVPAKGLPEN